MTESLTLVGALVAAVTALAAAVGVLWRDSVTRHNALEKRTESHLGVATEQMRVLALMESELGSLGANLNRIGAERTAQIQELSERVTVLGDKAAAGQELTLTQHGAQMAVLQTLQAVILQRQVDHLAPVAAAVIGEPQKG